MQKILYIILLFPNLLFADKLALRKPIIDSDKQLVQDTIKELGLTSKDKKQLLDLAQERIEFHRREFEIYKNKLFIFKNNFRYLLASGALVGLLGVICYKNIDKDFNAGMCIALIGYGILPFGYFSHSNFKKYREKEAENYKNYETKYFNSIEIKQMIFDIN